MDYTGHLSKIKNSLYVLDDFLSTDVCDTLLHFAESTPSIFNDRSEHRPNYDVKGEVGTYMSCGMTKSYYPDIWKSCALDKTINGFPVNEIQLNKYEKGEYIPPHRDMHAYLHTVIVPLQDEPKNNLVFGDPKAYYDNMTLEESDNDGLTLSLPDKKGTGYRFDGNIPVHWVPATHTQRYSAIFLYGLTL